MVIEETEEVTTEVEVIRIQKGLHLITIIKKETLETQTPLPEEDINHEVTTAVETTEATEATVVIAEVDIKIIATSTTKTKTKIVIKMKISPINNSILIHRNSNKKIKETSRSFKEIVAVLAVEVLVAIRKIMIITVVAETEEEMTNNSSIILDQGEAMEAKINIKTTATTQIIKILKMEATTRSIEILRRIRLIMSSKGILKKIRTSFLRITVITIRIIRNKFEDEN